jgi:hypothetical protein
MNGLNRKSKLSFVENLTCIWPTQSSGENISLLWTHHLLTTKERFHKLSCKS